MKLLPYLNFNGNCAEAIAFYEKVFGVTARSLFAKDMVNFDSNFQVEKGKENRIIHSSLIISEQVEIQFADCDVNGSNIGRNICLQLTYSTAEEVNAIYTALKVNAKIICELQPTFYAPLYAELIDQFGIRWSVMQEQKA